MDAAAHFSLFFECADPYHFEDINDNERDTGRLKMAGNGLAPISQPKDCGIQASAGTVGPQKFHFGTVFPVIKITV